MPFSSYLDSKRGEIKELIKELSKSFSYVSVLATDVKASLVNANRRTSSMSEGSASECGFVVKLNNGRGFYEYSTDDISGDKATLAQKIVDSVAISQSLCDSQIVANDIADEPLVQSFERPCDFDNYSPKQLIAFCEDIKDQLLAKDQNIVNAICGLNYFTVSKLFVSKNKELDQFYSWVNATAMVVYRNGEKMVMAREGSYSNLMSEALEKRSGGKTKYHPKKRFERQRTLLRRPIMRRILF